MFQGPGLLKIKLLAVQSDNLTQTKMFAWERTVEIRCQIISVKTLKIN